jgi:hypothetical protein
LSWWGKRPGNVGQSPELVARRVTTTGQFLEAAGRIAQVQSAGFGRDVPKEGTAGALQLLLAAVVVGAIFLGVFL